MSQTERLGTLGYRSFAEDPMAVFEQASAVRASTMPESMTDRSIADWIREAAGVVVYAVELASPFGSSTIQPTDTLRVPIGLHSFLVTQREDVGGFGEIVVRQEDLAAPRSFTARFEVDRQQNPANVATATLSAVVLDPRSRVKHRELVVDFVLVGIDSKIKYLYDGLAEKDPPREYREYEETVA